MSARVLLLGVGNPLMADDAVGLELATLVHEELEGSELRLECCPGLELVDAMTGHDRVVVFDAISSPDCVPGELYRLRLDGPRAAPPRSGHAFGLLETLELMRRLAMPAPEHVVIYAIGVEDALRFERGLSDSVRQALPELAPRIAEALRRWMQVPVLSPGTRGWQHG